MYAIRSYYESNPSNVEATFDKANGIFNIRLYGLTNKLKTQVIPVNSSNIKGILVSDLKSPNVNTIKIITNNNVRVVINSDQKNNSIIAIEKATNSSELLINGKSTSLKTLSYSGVASGSGSTNSNSNSIV